MAKNLSKHNYHDIDATIIADSKNEHGQRVTSFVLTYPRIIHAEMMTHRTMSRNAASSRAIPASKMIEKVEDNPFIPIKFQKKHSGMQGTEYFGDKDHETAMDLWLSSKDSALIYAKEMSDHGITKQIINRTLEPYQWYTALFTATEWGNFFALRADDAAEIHIQSLAYKMLEEYNNSTPKQLKGGEWHIPFGGQFDEEKLTELADHPPTSSMIPEHLEDIERLKVKIAVARCARVSYENFEGGDDYQKDIDLHDRLLKYGHMSPFEHCARAMSKQEFTRHNVLGDHKPTFGEKGWCGNFKGFIQLRKTYDNENRTDDRIET